MVVELISVPLTKDAVLVVHHFLALVQHSDCQNLKADGALEMAHAEIILICRVVCRHLVKAMSACEFLYFFFGHTETTHALLAISAKVHLFTDKEARTSTLVMHIWRLIGRQFVHSIHIARVFSY